VSTGALNGFTGAVALSIAGLPAGATASFAPSSIAGSGTSTLTITTTVVTAAGIYPLTVTGTSGALVHTANASMTVNAPATGGTLTATVAVPSGTQQLATIGTLDWVHWGRTSIALNRKSGVSPQISGFTVVGNTPANRYTNNPVAFAWTGGTPTATANTSTGVYISGQNNGFTITVPASTTVQTLNVYVGAWKAQGKLIAHLSDGSAPDVVDTSVSSATTTALGCYTIRFSAASSGQTLTLTYIQNDAIGGNVTLQAVTLAP
jgi:hypothetical protein